MWDAFDSLKTVILQHTGLWVLHSFLTPSNMGRLSEQKPLCRQYTGQASVSLLFRTTEIALRMTMPSRTPDSQAPSQKVIQNMYSKDSARWILDGKEKSTCSVNPFKIEKTWMGDLETWVNLDLFQKQATLPFATPSLKWRSWECYIKWSVSQPRQNWKAATFEMG